ncbi:MAG: ASCH domain-containing protein [Planctomycetota bacterium]
MMALTVQQPWASLILRGDKPIENRNWKPRTIRVGERFLIHASKTIDVWGSDWIDDALPLTTGAVIGSVVFAGVVAPCDLEADAREWATGSRWCWQLRDPEVLAKPIPMTGRRGLWHPDEGPPAWAARGLAAVFGG